MNKKIFATLILGIFLLSFASAVLDTKTFDKDKPKYGEISVKDWLGISNKADYRLMDYEDSVINVWAEGEYKLYKKTHLFTGVFYKDTFEKKGSLKDVKFFIWKYENTTYQKPIYEENCYLDYSNSTEGNNICKNILVDQEEIIKDTSHWVEYIKGMDLAESEGKWRMEAKRPKNKPVDFILEAHGKEFEEWAWFNNSWQYKREISSLNGTISALYNITYDSDMNANFSDLRFLDLATELIELNYTIVSKVDGVSAKVRVNNLDESNIMMYYGNAVVSTTSNSADLYYNPTSAYYLDESSGTTATDSVGSLTLSESGTSSTPNHIGQVDKAWFFDKDTDHLVSSSTTGISGTNSRSVSAWFKMDDGNVITIFGMGTGSSNKEFALQVNTGGLYFVGWANDLDMTSTTSHIVANKWYHTLTTYDGSTLRVYLDGVNVGNLTTAFATSDSYFRLGRRDGAGVSGNGTIDEVYLYDKALSIDQAKSLAGQNQPIFVVGAEQTAKGVVTTLIQPQTGSNFTNPYINFSFSSMPSDTNLTNSTLYLWNETDGNLTLTNFTTLSGINTTITTFFNNLSDGSYKWNAESCGEDVVCSFATSNNSFVVHTTSLSINITDPTGTTDYFLIGENETLNWILSESGENLSTHVKNCSYDYNNIITYLTIGECINISQVNFTYVLNQNNLTFTAIDEFGLINSETTAWDYKVIELNSSFNNETSEGSSEDFEVSLKIKNGLSLSSAIFHYGNLTEFPSISSVDGNYTLFLNNYMIPNVDGNQNITWFFEVVLDDSTEINTSSLIQYVKSIEIDDCSNYSNLIYRLELYDEETYNNLTGELDIILEIIPIGNGVILADYSNEFNSVQFKNICSSVNLSDSTLLLNSILRYGAENYTKEFYHIQKASLTDYPTTIKLYDIPLNKSTEFKLIYQNENLVKVSGAVVQLLRQRFDNGNFILVEAPLTSIESTTLVHINVESNKYGVNVVKDGVLLDSFTDIVFKCENELTGECSFDLFQSVEAPNLVAVETLRDFSYSIQSDNDSITIPFSIPSGTPNNVRVELRQKKITGTDLNCNTSVYSSSGSITCGFNESIDESTLELKIFKANELKAQRGFIVREDLASDFGKNNLFIVLILLFSLVGMFISSPEWQIIISAITLVLAGSLWLLNGMNLVVGLGGLAWLIVIAVILIKEISKQEDR